MRLFISCNRCTMDFPIDDPDLSYRKKKHEAFHLEYRIKNLNHGKVFWTIRADVM